MSAAAVRRDASGYGQDVINQSRPWPFPLDGVAVPVHLWQPVDDTSAPPEVACHLGPRLPDCWVRSVPDAGHLWHVDHAAIVLRTLLQR
jgi:hypothetical protein